ncbi:MAG: pyridoxine 5'-phosphate synthase [Phycisphaerales bacterium]|jgi:pyridoxine 5-phosphate synthase|nr:pyridoxine 5'-phosphate synthase [Phycisphaerales bacterium]
MIKLCVNIDHVATIRQARMTFEPDPILAADEAILGGSDGITLHIREDRRHMQDEDLLQLIKHVQVPLNLELAATPEMIELALSTKPNMAMIVPEGRDEITTEGGLNILGDIDWLTEVVGCFTGVGIRVSAFVDPDINQIDAAKSCGFNVCEIHTGSYAEAVIANVFSLDHDKVLGELSKISKAVSHVHTLGMLCNAGHGLTHHNVVKIASIEGISELHIGHSIVSRSVFVGMRKAVSEMKQQIEKANQ